MPQLDKFTFLDQILSILFFLLIIYLLNTYVFLPRLISILKFRARFFVLIKKNQKGLTFLLNNIKAKNQIYNNYYFTFFSLVNKGIFDIMKNYVYTLQYGSFTFLFFRNKQ